MKLRTLTIRRLPGINRPFRVENLGDGLNLVVGPNGSGKSSLCRAVRALLWPETVDLSPFSVASGWEEAGAAVHVEREGSRVRWQRDGMDEERPELPADRFARCFTLGVRDLLLEERATDAAIASEIRSQMSGGYDIGALLAGSFAERPREGQAEDRKIREFQGRLRDLRSRDTALVDREDSQRGLEEELAEAREAGERLELLQTARKVASARAGLEEVRLQLSRLPAGMERIQGGETGQIDEVEADLGAVREELAECRRSHEDAQRRVEDGRLPGGAAEGPELQAWLERARELRGLEEELARAEETRVKAQGRRDTARAALDPAGSPGPSSRLGPEALTKIELFLPRIDKLRAQRSALEAERRLLAEEKGAPDASRRELERGIEALDRWLSASELRNRLRTGWAIPAALVALLAGAATGLLLHWAGWVLCGAGLGGLLLTLWLRAAVGRAGDDRLEFERLDLAAPEIWEPDSVRERRQELKDWLDDLLEDERLAARRSVLDTKLSVVIDSETELEAERQELRDALGIDPGTGDVGSAVLADRARAWFVADEEYGETTARLEFLGSRHEELQARINAFLRASGVQDGADAAALVHHLEELKDSGAKRLRAQQDLEEQAARQEKLLQKIERLERRGAEIFRRAGLEPGDREGLDERLRELERYGEFRERESRLGHDLEQDRSALAGRDDLLDQSAELLDAEIARLKESVSRIGELNREIGSIEEAVRKARGDDAVGRRMAELASAREQLTDRLEAKLERAAGAFLLKSILEEYDRGARPELLKRAAELFARFTHHEYELILERRDGAPEFRARETSSGQGRKLSELSDGTRVQLLLAARLAFATRADRRRRVPLFLDEVLTTSDPARFAAVAESLLVLVREEGRQVFYLTSNPSDAARWAALLEPEERERLRTVDLAALRSLAGAAAAATEIEVEPVPEVPSPEGLSAGQYGLAIEAPRLEPRRPVEGLHLIHLLDDDLNLLYRLLQKRISTLGQWRSLINLGQAARLAGEEQAARLSALGDLAAAFFEAWVIGRGRPVDGEALRLADGVSETFRGKLTDLAGELGGDAALLVRALEERSDGRVSGFREKQLEAFRNWLIGEGYLDPREPLDEPALQGRVLEALGRHLESRRLSLADVAAHVRRLFELAGGDSGGK